MNLLLLRASGGSLMTTATLVLEPAPYIQNPQVNGILSLDRSCDKVFFQLFFSFFLIFR
jgi:hypothetical protein